MSVLYQSGEEQVECPLCMEPLEVDDLNFFPCTCGYQICRFCWHRIRTDENGLCPACRKAYSENPADFTPLSKEQVAQLKVEKRQRDQQRKAKLSESRKHLANVRVVQKNLVFVVGLPLRLADVEILKRHEYFGKFGKIHKVVINQSTSYAGSQGPSASAYVTYVKSDDALRAIQSVNNITIDGRLLKSSLGTTKYCSHFMKNQPCPKPDCMYLHDFGDPEASFTKEQMHAGKHQEYEKKLHDALVSKAHTQNATQSDISNVVKHNVKGKEGGSNGPMSNGTNNTNKENWPQLNSDKKCDAKDTGKEKSQKSKSKSRSVANNNNDTKKLDRNKNCDVVCQNGKLATQVTEKPDKCRDGDKTKESSVMGGDFCDSSKPESVVGTPNVTKLPLVDDNSSFFSQNAFHKIVHANDIERDDTSMTADPSDQHTVSQILNDSLPNINSSEDWEAAFGFSKHNAHLDELARQRNAVKDTLETFGNGIYSPLDMFGALDSYQQQQQPAAQQNGYETMLDVLSGKGAYTQSPSLLPHFSKHDDRTNASSTTATTSINHFNAPHSNGLDQMSKFFSDFYKNGQKDLLYNGLNGQTTNGYIHNSIESRNLLMLQQRQIEEQLMNLNMKQQAYNNMNGLHGGASQFANGGAGDLLNGPQLNYSTLHSQIYQQNSMQMGGGKSTGSRAEDELDFDPFHETQKALAELVENEQTLHKLHANARNNSASGAQINGLVPPPPPGFIQPHMNSFGSKILPYLNMSQSQMNGTSTQNGWPITYNNHIQQPQQQQQKSVGMCNDWKVLDPAIVTSSRHFALTNMQQQLREQFAHSNLQQQQQQQQHHNQLRSYDYPNLSNFSPQLQQNGSYNTYNHNIMQHNLNWLGAELNSQIPSPPGFRASNQATKQQEC